MKPGNNIYIKDRLSLSKSVRFALCLFVCGLLFLGGCGYTTRSLITLQYQTIYVRPFVNKIDITSDTSVARKYNIYHPLLETDITNQVIDQFILDGDLRIDKEQEADLILAGELIDYRRDALRYTADNDEEVEEYRLSISVRLKLQDTAEGIMLWEESVVGDATYLTEGTESTAINEAIEDLARRVVERVVEVW